MSSVNTLTHLGQEQLEEGDEPAELWKSLEQGARAALPRTRLRGHLRAPSLATKGVVAPAAGRSVRETGCKWMHTSGEFWRMYQKLKCPDFFTCKYTC